MGFRVASVNWSVRAFDGLHLPRERRRRARGDGVLLIVLIVFVVLVLVVILWAGVRGRWPLLADVLAAEFQVALRELLDFLFGVRHVEHHFTSFLATLVHSCHSLWRSGYPPSAEVLNMRPESVSASW